MICRKRNQPLQRVVQEVPVAYGVGPNVIFEAKQTLRMIRLFEPASRW